MKAFLLAVMVLLLLVPLLQVRVEIPLWALGLMTSWALVAGFVGARRRWHR